MDLIKDLDGETHMIFSTHLENNDNDIEQIGNKFDDFEILAKLGEGSYGSVFKVRSKINKNIYALKKANLKKLKDICQKAYDSTIHEAIFLSHLSHPNVVKYYRSFKEGDFLYMIIEFIENGDIDGFINSHRKFKKYISEEILWSIFLQSMKGLAYIHKQGVIHRDIKPGNLLMNNNMNIKLGDFGVSAVKPNNEDESTQYLNAEYNFFKNADFLRYNKTFIGTKKYMADEILKDNDYDQKVDVYSMGATFFEMCYLHSYKTFEIVMDEYGNTNRELVPWIKPEDEKVPYSKELLRIISLMIEPDKEKRKSSEYFLKMIQDEFSKKYVKNTSIDSIIRCFYTFDDIRNYYLNLTEKDVINKPVTRAFITCLKSFTQTGLQSWFDSIKNLREIICTENTELEKSNEIEARTVLKFLLTQLHKETSVSLIEKNDDNKYYIISGEEEAPTSEIDMSINFLKKYMTELNSYISHKLFGIKEISKICNECKIKTFSFSSFFFLTFSLNKISMNVTIKKLNITNLFNFYNTKKKQKKFYCIKCLKFSDHNYYEEFYTLPDFIIISIKRGVTNTVKVPLIIEEILDLTKVVKINGKKYKLVGFINKEENDEKFKSQIIYNNSWYTIDKNNITKINTQDFLENSKEEVIMLFYQIINQ